MSNDGMELLGSLMSANAAALAQTTNRIEAGLRRDVVDACTVAVELWDVIEQATVVDRATEARLVAMGYRIASIDRLLEHTQQMQRRFDGLEVGASD